MPANPVQINLLGESDLEHTPLGRIISWATTYGRYIMIGTEIVVLLAFISRFSLDRKLTDLKEEISQKQEIIEANRDLEGKILRLQQQLTKIKGLLADQDQPLQLLNLLQKSLPSDVYLESLEANQNQLKIAAVAGTTNGFAELINTINTNPEFREVELGEVKKTTERGIQFQLTALFTPAKK